MQFSDPKIPRLSRVMCIFLGILAIYLPFSARAEADPIVTVVVTGIVNTSDFTSITADSAFGTILQYDSADQGMLITPGHMLYSEQQIAPLAVGDSLIAFNQARVTVLDDFNTSGVGTGPYVDAVDWVSGLAPLSFYGPLAAELGWQSCEDCDAFVRLFWENEAATYPVGPLTSLSLPSAFPPLSAWESAIFRFGFYDPDTMQNLLAQGTITRVLAFQSTTPAPEGGGTLQFLGVALVSLLGLNGLGVLRRSLM